MENLAAGYRATARSRAVPLIETLLSECNRTRSDTVLGAGFNINDICRFQWPRIFATEW